MNSVGSLGVNGGVEGYMRTPESDVSSITVLRHASLNMVKTWLPDGTIKAYDRAKHFTIEERPVSNFDELCSLLTCLQEDPHACFIRGAYIGKEPVGRMTRIGAHLDDLSSCSILIEVDGFEPLSADPVTDPLPCIAEYIHTVLPTVFHDASYHWQLSNSAGHPKYSDKLKVHLWFFLQRPYTSLQLREWAKAIQLACDHSVFNPAQIHYTGKPIFEPGVIDPVPVRSGTVRGAVDAVPLVIDPAILETAATKVRPRKDGLVGETLEDPVATFLHEQNLVLSRTVDRLSVKCPWNSGHSSGTPGDTSSAWLVAGTGNHERGHYKCLHQSCAERTDQDFLDAVGFTDWFALDGFEDLTSTSTSALIIPVAPAWPYLVRYESGQVKPLIRNLVSMLARPDLTARLIQYDAFRDEVLLGHSPFTDVDYTRLRLRLESPTLNFAQVSREKRDAVLAVALDATFDSAQDWLNGLEWDGTERIEMFYSTHLGTADTPYTRAVSLYQWTAQAGRVLDPGCQVDIVPVWIGLQGSGKSSAIRAMVPDNQYYVELSLSADDDDLARMVKGVLVAELPELRGLRGKEIDHIKAYITKREEEYIPKYMEKKARYPRRVVFIGTTNQEEFLADETGNRRWLPVMVGRQDVSAIERDRLQLWAEARDRVKRDGIQWRGAEALGRSEHVNHMVHDPWESAIVNWIHAPVDQKGNTHAMCEFLTSKQIFLGALDLDVKKLTKGDEMRLAAILRGLGHERGREFINGKQVRVWRPPRTA